ncbi:MAG: 5'-nucleotidase C-terminal domain-containing protein [Bacteroidales bacterium]|nr:5'-nucleotidase C-terminal domain-containing protein [Bacteroidales bacterium]
MYSKLLTALIISAFVTSCGQEKEWKLNNAIGNYLQVDFSNAIVQDSAILAEIAPFKQHLDSSMNIVIAQSEKEYFKKKPNGSLNNIVCDMVFDVITKRFDKSPYKPDLCLLNYGGLRRPLPKGDIMISDIYQLMPFQNESVICQLSGKQMNEMFQYLKKSNGQPIANMLITFTKDQLKSVTIGKLPYDSTKTYNVLTSDYTAKGGDKMNFFLKADTMVLCGSLLRDDMFTYIYNQKDKKLVASDEKRIIFE